MAHSYETLRRSEKCIQKTTEGRYVHPLPTKASRRKNSSTHTTRKKTTTSPKEDERHGEKQAGENSNEKNAEYGVLRASRVTRTCSRFDVRCSPRGTLHRRVHAGKRRRSLSSLASTPKKRLWNAVPKGGVKRETKR
mmetsp:Transcript_11098/g.23583  ORF Transcript_11098/g.23583 Transcript_11098/m.23583 type:complete len:137 (+) Transcript_11098:937-1347(+)